MDEDFVSQGLVRVEIERADVEGMRDGWLTDSCIREVIARFGNLKTSRVNIIDPNWFREWIRQGFPVPEVTPDFFAPNQGVAFVQGLAIPFNEDNRHWSAIYVDLEHCSAIYFNTMPCIEREHNAREVMRRFYMMFSEFFQGTGMNQFQFVVDQQTPSQGDTETCGIYVVAAGGLLDEYEF
ncbi:uncharacterized protein PAC_02363 [Phialocephala subalpina]|uniref:Ubiquitin-like protease family profile domain-containing protein n=1 Tax=Phialocephala subalpina TaxID=576137 RepID=A0A1L7WI94_9HELO|nr:uncharacterized protein PAC_02363 [Phialocephala subalpina]